jgi:hypothetical protein
MEMAGRGSIHRYKPSSIEKHPDMLSIDEEQ